MPSKALTASCVLSVHRVEPSIVMPASLSPVVAFSPKPSIATRKTEMVKRPEFSEGARLLAAARTIPASDHALVKLLFGANNPVTASMDAAPLDTD